MTTYVYNDRYLSKFITNDVEARAIADVAVLAGSATFSAPWIQRLAIAQAYVLAALENQADPEDLFAAKLKTYRQQLEVLLPQARYDASQTAGVVDGFGLFGVPMERG